MALDSWPCDCRRHQSSSLAGRKQKATESTNYPLLGHGAPNAYTLVQESGRFQWASVFKDNNPHDLHFGKRCIAFPPTYPPSPITPRLPASRQAEQGANFLRTYHPDVDVSSELIREHLAEAAKFTHQLKSFDPYAGNLLESVAVPNSQNTMLLYLAFPMGELKGGLNLSPLTYLNPDGLTFKPSATPVKVFDTPILQIVSSKSGYSHDRGHRSNQASCLAVRTLGSTTLFNLEIQQDACAVLHDLVTLSRAETGDHAIVDMRITSESQTYMVNGRGTVYSGDFSDGRTALNAVYSGIGAAENDLSQAFWRMGLGTTPSECILVSTTDALFVDTRVDKPVKLLSLTDWNSVFTSVEDESSDEIIRLCTTDRVLWIDKRYPNKPLLGFKHGRNFDRTLQTQTMQIKRGLTFLTSRKNSLMTVYDVSRLDNCPITVHTLPYSPSSLTGCNKPNLSQLVLQHPDDTSNTNLTMFQLCERGSLKCLDFFASLQEKADTKVEWSEDVMALDAKSSTVQLDVGVLGMRDRIQVDLSHAYEYLFQEYDEDLEKVEGAENFYEIIDKASSYWQRIDTSEEQVLTAYDVLVRAREETEKAFTADFLSDCTINSVRGYHALAQGRLSTEMLGKGTAWYHDISPTLKCFIPQVTQDIQQLTDRLSRFDLQPKGDRTYRSMRREVRAREQLALDLVLASSVYSNQPLSRPKKTDGGLESMTEALSLDNDPPPLQFGYFHPVQQEGEDNKAVIGPAGVRLLLGEWESGTDPRDYVYCDPYEESGTEGRPRPQMASEGVVEVARQMVRPPTVLALSSLPPHVVAEATVQGLRQDVYSQAVGDRAGLTPVSQDVVVSTQILGGRYGGRPGVAKKKKRLGGF
ncbi:hypothetical protein AX17_003417 [Amanita inopinata Kibby_2008]|nr:hypothetical protein AX17_003417 [Amanita inopinata Kibby_2008]